MFQSQRIGSVPGILPSLPRTLQYRVQLNTEGPWGGGGVLPGLGAQLVGASSLHEKVRGSIWGPGLAGGSQSVFRSLPLYPSPL